VVESASRKEQVARQLCCKLLSAYMKTNQRPSGLRKIKYLIAMHLSHRLYLGVMREFQIKLRGFLCMELSFWSL
jgi:hypothetical protein